VQTRQPLMPRLRRRCQYPLDETDRATPFTRLPHSSRDNTAFVRCATASEFSANENPSANSSGETAWIVVIAS
jgi:hypothetical protein